MIFALAGCSLLAAFGCIKQAARRWFPDMSAAVYLLLCAGIGTGSQIYYCCCALYL